MIFISFCLILHLWSWHSEEWGQFANSIFLFSRRHRCRLWITTLHHTEVLSPTKTTYGHREIPQYVCCQTGKQAGHNKQGAWASVDIWMQIVLLISEESTSPTSFQGFQNCSCHTWVLSCQGDVRAQPATQNVCFNYFYPVLQMLPLQPPRLYSHGGGSTILFWDRCL